MSPQDHLTCAYQRRCSINTCEVANKNWVADSSPWDKNTNIVQTGPLGKRCSGHGKRIWVSPPTTSLAWNFAPSTLLMDDPRLQGPSQPYPALSGSCEITVTDPV